MSITHVPFIPLLYYAFLALGFNSWRPRYKQAAVPIYQGVNTYRPDGTGGYIRGLERAGCPTVEALEDLVKDLEGASWALATSSGMPSVGQVLFGLLQNGDRILAHRCTYYATNLMLR